MAFQVTTEKKQLPTQKGGHANESQTFCKENVREMQDRETQGQSHGHLRKPEAQTAPGLTAQID
jgi:hypothetical protein